MKRSSVPTTLAGRFHPSPPFGKRPLVNTCFLRLRTSVGVLTGAIAHALGATASECDINAAVSDLVSTGDVRAVLDDGVVRLSGHVAERAEARRIERTVRDMSGISRVVNDISVA